MRKEFDKILNKHYWSEIGDDEAFDALLNLLKVGVTLPNMYKGSLNNERIKMIDTIAETYKLDKNTIRRLFCDGADWYKQVIKDSGN